MENIEIKMDIHVTKNDKEMELQAIIDDMDSVLSDKGYSLSYGRSLSSEGGYNSYQISYSKQNREFVRGNNERVSFLHSRELVLTEGKIMEVLGHDKFNRPVHSPLSSEIEKGLFAKEMRKIANKRNGVVEKAEEIKHKTLEATKNGQLHLDFDIAENKFTKNQLGSLIGLLIEEGFSISITNKPEELVTTLKLDWSGRAIM